MRLPNVEQAVVADAKIIHYLLSESHPKGRRKAAFFGRFGFSVENWQLLAEALLHHAAENEVASTLTTEHGVHYSLEGRLHTPDGRDPFVRSVWAIDTGSTTPRLITAYPSEEPEDEE